MVVMRKLIALAMVFILAVTAVGCGRETDDEDRDRDDRVSRREESGKTRDGLFGSFDDPWIEEDPEAFWGESWDYGEGEEEGRPGKSAGGGDFYDLTLIAGLDLMFIFKELAFTYVDIYGSEIGLSYSFIGDETVGGQNTKRFACTYYERHQNYTEYNKDCEFEVWIREDLEMVQAWENGELFSNPYDCSAINLKSALYEFGNSYLFVRHEDEIPDKMKMGRWELEDKKQETKDFGFGNVTVTCYTLSTSVEYATGIQTEYLDWEYAKIGSKFLRTREKYYAKTAQAYVEIIVEKAIPF